MARLAQASVLASLLFACAAHTRAQEPALEYQVKAAFLLNFTKFVTWPDSVFADQHSPLEICIIGDDPFGGTLRDMVKGESLNGRSIFVQRIQRAPGPKTCQVLYVAKSERDPALILGASGPGVLTVGEGEKFLRNGGIIAFVVEERKVRFDIDQRAAAKAMVALSARLLNVARNVER